MLDHHMNELSAVDPKPVGHSSLAGFIPQQTSLRVQVADFLRDAILSGNLKPGERVVERTLAKSLGVGQATVREALQVLEHEGLIFKKVNSASFVTQLPAERIAEIVDIRLELEPKAFALAQRRRTSADLDELKNLVSSIEQGVEKNDYYQTSRSDLAFHQKVWSIAGNQTLERILSQLCTPLFAYLMVFLSSSGSPLKERVKSHEILVAALAEPDEENAVQAARHHTINSWFQFLPKEQESEGG
jgi:DNA-binding GntR family transcriptional regulator